MSTTVSLLQGAAGAVAPVAPIVRAMLSFSLFAGVLVLFKPLLVGLVRALLLTIKPRRSKEDLAARKHMRDAQMLHRMISATHCPSHAAELRAIAARN